MMTNLLRSAFAANKLFSTIARLRLLLVMFVALSVSVNAWAEEVTFLPNELTAVTSRDYSYTKENITIAVTTSTVTAEEFRIFKNQTLTISTTNDNKITGVEITCTKENTTKYGPGCFGDYDGYSYSSYVGTWSGSANSISLKASNDQVRATSIVVTYSSASSGDPVDPPTTYTIKWHTAVGITTDDILNEGEIITQPATDPTMTGYKFMGWTEDCEVASDGAGFTAISNFGTATEDKDYYAVFAIATNPSGGGATETTASVKIQNYASANSWANSTKYTSVKIDENITASVSGSTNTGKYYTSGHEWRLYQTESAKLTISATEGKTIKTAKITYNVSNSGVLKLNSSNVTSGTTSTINALSVTYNVGNSGAATNGQVKVTAIEVVYTSGAGGGGTTTYDNYITTCATQTTVCLVHKYGRARYGLVPDGNGVLTVW